MKDNIIILNCNFCSVKVKKYKSKKTVLEISSVCDFCNSEYKTDTSKVVKNKLNKCSGMFCSRLCANTNNSRLRNNIGVNSKNYRRKGISKFGYKCNNKDCALLNIDLPEYMYEVDHIDSNHNNNDVNNLQVLCVWCHRKKTYNKKY